MTVSQQAEKLQKEIADLKDKVKMQNNQIDDLQVYATHLENQDQKPNENALTERQAAIIKIIDAFMKE